MENKKIENKSIIENFRGKKLLVILMVVFFSTATITLAKYIKTTYFELEFYLVGEAFNDTGLIDSDVNLTASTEILKNPYRGFYYHTNVELPVYIENDSETNELNKQELLNKMDSNIKHLDNSDNTLSLNIIYLNNYKEEETLPTFYLDALNKCMEKYRKSGYKTIIRFAYGDSYAAGDTSEFANEPSDFNILLGHVRQLKTFFETNKDVIHTVQLGFIGPWGEMHSSVYATTEYINQLIDVALESVPYPLQISLRRPRYYREYFNDNSFFDESLAYTDTDRARIGLFNDAYISSETDKGTYESGTRESELEWQDYLTKYVISGGEMAYSGETYPTTEDHYFGVSDAKYNMEKTHMNYLHDGHATAVLQKWKETAITSDIDPDYEGLDAYTYFANKFGYRFLLKNAKVPGYSVKQGEQLYFETTILNEGFGNLIYKRNIYVILEKDGKYYKAITDKNPSYWLVSESCREEFVFKLPSNIETGTWNIYLYLPDIYEENDNSAIKFANKNIFNSYLNANYIGKINVVEGNSNVNKGFFQLNDLNETIEDDATLYEIQRKTNIDGKLTDEYEWIESDILYNDGITSLYIREDESNIYLLCHSNEYVASEFNIQMDIATSESTNSLDYKYMTENARIYNGSYSNGGIDDTSKTTVEFNADESFEYIIPKTRMNIQSKYDIIGVKIKYIDATWENTYAVVIDQFNLESSIIVDGKNTNSEWKDENLKYSDSDVKLYIKEEYNFMYIYLETIYPIETTSAIIYTTSSISEEDTDFIRKIEMNKIIETESGSNNIIGEVKYVKDIGFEYRVELYDLDIQTIEEIKGIQVKLYNTNVEGWENLYNKNISFTNQNNLNITIDGKNEENEWLDIYKVHENDTSIIYLASDNNYLYFYGELKNNPTINYDHIQVSFSTKQESEDSQDYAYMTEDSSIYTGSYVNGGVDSDSKVKVTEYAYDNAFEYKILLSKLGIEQSSDIIGIYINYLTEWTSSIKEEINISGEKSIIIDGINTNSEWTNEMIIAQNSQMVLYANQLNNNIYFYGEAVSEFENIKMYLSTLQAADSSEFNFQIENKSLYTYVDSSYTYTEELSTERLKNSFEYKIPIESIGISTIQDIISMRIKTIDASWETVNDIYIYDILNKIIIDGEISNENEWTSEQLIGSKNGLELYSKKVGNDIYYYISYAGDITTVSNYSITYYNGDLRIAKIENSTLYLRNEDDSGWIKVQSDIPNDADTGIEVVIDITNLNMQDTSNVTSYKVQLMDSEWNSLQTETF